MKKRQLNFRFHNPNSEPATVDFLLEILMEANEKKVQEAIREAAASQGTEEDGEEGPETHLDYVLARSSRSFRIVADGEV